MRRLLTCLGLCLLLLGGCSRTPKEVTLVGRVVGHDGKAMRGAFALVDGMGIRERVAVGSDGRFSLTLQDPGGYFIWLVGVHHRSVYCPLLIEELGRVRFDARLSAAQYVDRIDSVLVIGDFNDFSDTRGGRPMTRFPDGTFRLAIETAADTLAYQVVGVQAEGRPLAGTAADRYVCPPGTVLADGRAGSMVSVLRVTGDSLLVTFDPRELPRSGEVEVLRFDDPRSRMARLLTLHEDLEQRSARHSEAFQRHLASGNDRATFQYDWTPDRTALRTMIESETDPVLRQYLLLGYFSHTSPGPEDSSLAQRALAEIPPTSIVWSLQSGGASITLPTISHLAKQPEMAQVYADSIIEAHPDRTVRASFLFSQVMNASRALENQQQRTPDPNVQAASSDTTRFARLLDRLVSEYGDTPWAEFARKFFPRERNVLPGREVPDFTVVSLDDSTVTLTRQSLRGRVYLMDFWAVWCGPCVAEMPFLHAAHARFKDRGFTILSLSFDKHRLDVRDYRQATWPMPWLHGFVDGGSDSDLAMRFEVAGIPRSILVDRDGTIRATELRGKKLEETLAAMFEQQSPPTH